MSYKGLRSETVRCCSRGNGQTAYTIWSKVGELLSSLTAEFKTASGSNISTRTVYWELHEKGLCGRVAACKHHITMLNAKCWLEWCKACHAWSLQQWKLCMCSFECAVQILVWQTPRECYQPECIVPIL